MARKQKNERAFRTLKNMVENYQSALLLIETEDKSVLNMKIEDIECPFDFKVSTLSL